MTRQFCKEDIETHYDYQQPPHPAINVKAHRWPLTTYKVMERFGCTEKQAETALEFAFQQNCESFWEEAKELATQIFGKGAKVYSEGRQGGWLVVFGIDRDVESWDAIKVSQWGRFAKQIKAAMDGYLEPSRWLEDIEANRWAEPNAEMYNFVETKDGKTACIVDIVRIQTEAKVAYLASL